MDKIASVDRRLFLGASAAALSGLTDAAFAQQPKGGGSEKSETTMPDKTISQRMADYIAGFDLKVVPPAAVERARIAFIDTVGVMLAGSQEEVSHILVDMVKAEGSTPAATVVGQSLRASPQLAALANGVAAHAMDFDFTYISGQAISAVIPAVLPLAETTGATPADALAAFIIGAEVGGRVARANFRASSVGGWHTTGTVGAVAATAAAARLLKLPPEKTANALGISTSLASGLSGNFGTMTKPLHSGHAARNGIMAAQLGMRGFTAHPAVFERHSGYFSAFGRGLDVTLKPFDDFGSRYDIVSSRLDLKAYPCGGLTHTSIEAALDLRSRIGARLDQIKSIHCAVTRNAAQRAGTQYPTTIEGAKFSVSYLVAYALVHGVPKIAAFSETAIADEQVKAVAKLVTASVDPALGDGTHGSPARITITLADGQTLEQRNDDASGSTKKPMTAAQIEDKFSDCAAQALSVDAAKRTFAFLNTLPDQHDFESFWPPLRKA